MITDNYIIGVGQCGGNLCQEYANHRGINLIDARKNGSILQFITARTDNNNLVNAIILHTEGSGKNVNIAMKEICIPKNIQTVDYHLDKIPNGSRVEIYVALGGGSGNAITPTICQKLLIKDCQVVCIGIFPALWEGNPAVANAVYGWHFIEPLVSINEPKRITFIPISNETIARWVKSNDTEHINAKIWDILNTLLGFPTLYLTSDVHAHMSIDANEYDSVMWGRLNKANRQVTGGGIIGYSIQDCRGMDDGTNIDAMERFPKLDIGDYSKGALDIIVSIALKSYGTDRESVEGKKKWSQRLEKLGQLASNNGAIKGARRLIGMSKLPFEVELEARSIIMASGCTLTSLIRKYKSKAGSYIRMRDNKVEKRTDYVDVNATEIDMYDI